MIKRLIDLLRTRTPHDPEARKGFPAPSCCEDQQERQTADQTKSAITGENDLRIYFGGCC